jgi:hypothetical protein
VNPVGEPDAGNPHVRFDERGEEPGCRPKQAHRPAPLLDSTCASKAWSDSGGRFHTGKVDDPGSWRAMRLGNRPCRSPATKAALGRRAIQRAVTRVKPEQASKIIAADADLTAIQGRPHAWGSNRRTHPRDPPGYWARHVGKALYVPRETRPVATSRSRAVGQTGVGEARSTAEAG